MSGRWGTVSLILFLVCVYTTVQAQIADDPFPVPVGSPAQSVTSFHPFATRSRVQSQWSRGQDLPVGMGYMGALYEDGAIFICGGLNGNRGTLSSVFYLDIRTSAWTTLDPMTTGRCLSSVEIVDSMIYVIGGYRRTLPLEYDYVVLRLHARLHSWTRLSKMDIPVFAAGSFVDGGRIFILGGGRHELNLQTDTIQIYNPGTDTWTISPTRLPRAMRSFGTVYLHGVVYTIGGYAYGVSTGTFHGEVYRGVVAGDSIIWSRLADFPGGPLIRMSTGTDGRLVYLTGGYDETTHRSTYPTNRTWSYDPATDLWTELEPKPTAVQYASRMLYDGAGRFYVAGGVDHTQYRSEVEVFDPSMPVSDVEIIPTETDITLEQNHPNPFNPSTTIVFSLPTRSQVELVVHDGPGREVTRLVDGTREAGVHRVVFDGGSLPSGVYRAVLRASGRTLSRSMVLVR